MFFLVVVLITLAAFSGAFGLWILFWSFAMASKEQAGMELIGQTNMSDEVA